MSGGRKKGSRLEEAFQAAVAAHRSGRLREAESLYQQVLARDARYLPALLLLGALKGQAGDFVGAEKLTRDALAAGPADPRARVQLGNVLLAQQRYDEAFTAFGDALALDPSIPEAHLNRGAILMLRKQPEGALACFDAALKLTPRFAPALCNRGNALQDLNRHGEALAAYDEAIRQHPANAEYLASRANCLHRLGRNDAALTDIDAAVKLQPSHPDFHYNRGNILAALKRSAEAFAAFDAAYRLAPDLPYAEGDRLYAKLAVCDWSDIDRELAHVAEGVRNGRMVARPFSFLSMSPSPSLQAQCARLFVEREFPAKPALWRGGSSGPNKIRLAYLSSDFHAHATAYLMAEVFERHDRQRFTVSAYSLGADDGSDMRRRLTSAFDTFVDCTQMSDGEAARAIAEAGIDILVDLKGFTQDARPNILASRPAPVQVNYLGYPGTMAAPYMDYIVGDGTILTAADADDFSEKLVLLPGCYQPNDRKRQISERVFDRGELGLPADGFVFCCFNNTHKIMPDVFDSWMRILRAVPGSVLWLLGESAAVRANLEREAAARGVDPARLVFADKMRLSEHLARHSAADLFLDTLPYNAHTTASDALWAGLPMITQIGASFAARVGASLLQAVGLPDLIARSREDYEALAIGLASDRDRLGAIRTRLSENRMTLPLFDTPAFTRGLEAAYEAMVGRHRAGLPPDHIDLAVAN